MGEEELIGYTADELAKMVSQFGVDAATREALRAAATQAGTSAAAATGLNAAAGLGSLLSPLSLFSTIKGIGDYIVAGNEAERARREAEFRAAVGELQAAGFDPYQTYSTDVLQSALDAAGWSVPGMDVGALSSQMIGDTVSRYIQDPTAYSGITTPTQSLAPVDYAKDVLELPGQIWDDPSSILGVILGPGGITGNVEWGGGTIDNAPGSAPAVYTGKVGEKVYTGASTGIPSVDAAIRRVLGQTEGGETTTMDVVQQTIEDITGYPATAVADILESVFEDTGASLPSPTTPTTPTGGTGATTDQQDKVTVGTDTDLIDKVMQVLQGKKSDSEIRQAAIDAGVTPEEIAKVTGVSQDEVNRRWEGAGGPFDTSGDATVVDTTTDQVLDTTTGQVLDTTTGQDATDTVVDTTGDSVLDTVVDTKGDSVLDTVVDTKGDSVLDTVVGQGPTTLEPEPQILETPSTPAAGGGTDYASALLAMMPQYRTVTTKESPLAEIEYLYDIGGESIFAPKTGEPDEEARNLARIRQLGGVPYAQYAQGGQVDIVELALQLLRG